jgi:hypothetical protein
MQFLKLARSPPRRTVDRVHGRYLNDDLQTLLASARDRRPRQVEPYLPYLQQRFTGGCTNAAQLHREVAEHGFTSNVQAVRLLHQDFARWHSPT